MTVIPASNSIKENDYLIINNEKKYLISKRVLDIVLSLLGLMLLSPILLIIAALIKLENIKAPIFFKQVRVGENKKEFNIYKFRSMVIDAEDLLESVKDKNEVAGAMFKMKNDPRITYVGKFIRKTSIDELPQLYNVIRGEMSLVGPRPPLPLEVKEYNKEEQNRLLVKPGCTGLWQVSGRSNVGFKEMVQMDFEYMKRRNLLFDIKLIIKTVFVMLFSKDAY